MRPIFTLLVAGAAACSSSRTTGTPASADGGVDAVTSMDSSASGDAPSPEAAADGSPWTFTSSTSVAELTQNDTSACGTAVAPCSSAWTASHSVTYGAGSSYAGTTRTVDGFWNRAVPAGGRSPGSSKGYVSKVPVGTLLGSYDVPVWVETQNWWGGGGGHIDNGEDSPDGTQIQSQIADQISRGFAGQVVDWYGPGTTADKALPFIQSNAEASGGKYRFAVMLDKGFFTSCGETVACLNQALAYLVSTYAGSPAYLVDSSGHPILFFFINQYYPTEYALLQSAGVDAKGSTFVMYEPDGFPGSSPPNTIGEYAWVNPSDGVTYTPTTGAAGTFSSEPDFGLKDLTAFFGAASSNTASYAVSEAHKGFDDNLANWSLNRIIDQQCGTTWLESFDHTGTFGGSAGFEASFNYLASGKHLDMVMVDTWDDYEEGTEIETGIDNCLAQLDVTLTASTLSWNPTFGADPMSSAVFGSEATLDHYDVYLAREGGTDLMPVAQVPCSGGTCGHSLGVSGLGIAGGPYVFYVDAVGKPSIVSTLSGPTAGSFVGP